MLEEAPGQGVDQVLRDPAIAGHALQRRPDLGHGLDRTDHGQARGQVDQATEPRQPFRIGNLIQQDGVNAVRKSRQMERFRVTPPAGDHRDHGEIQGVGDRPQLAGEVGQDPPPGRFRGIEGPLDQRQFGGGRRPRE